MYVNPCGVWFCLIQTGQNPGNRQSTFGLQVQSLARLLAGEHTDIGSKTPASP